MVKRTFSPHPVFDLQALSEFLREREFKASHADRILSHAARKLVAGDLPEAGLWEDCEGLPKDLAAVLPKHFTPLSSKVVESSTSSSGDTTKLVVEMQDGMQVEAVIMRYDPKQGRDPSKEDSKRRGERRATLCLSSQVGCQMACKFCATGTMGLKGNLNAAEIFEQLVHAMRVEKIRNIVFMGMGEPLNNYKSVCASIKLMVDGRLYGLAPSHICVSTVGVTNRIKSMAADMPGVNLALSLHAPNQELRLSIVPTGKAYPVHKLMDACRSWQEATGKRVFFEYVVLGEVNDNQEQAEELGALLKEFDCVLNLIPWNPTEGGAMEGYKAPAEERLATFQRTLREAYGIRTTVRREFGQDINSACGQLVIKSGEAKSSCSGGGKTKVDDW